MPSFTACIYTICILKDCKDAWSTVHVWSPKEPSGRLERHIIAILDVLIIKIKPPTLKTHQAGNQLSSRLPWNISLLHRNEEEEEGARAGRTDKRQQKEKAGSLIAPKFKGNMKKSPQHWWEEESWHQRDRESTWTILGQRVTWLNQQQQLFY